MYIMYVDESGDCGHPTNNSPSRYFILSAFVLHELRWNDVIDEIINLREELKNRYNIRMNDELHAGDMINKRACFAHLPFHIKLLVLKRYITYISNLNDINTFSIVLDKLSKPVDYDVFTHAWRALLQRFENTISRRNFVGPSNSDERGIVFCDNTDGLKLMRLYRRMRRYNPIPNKGSAGYRQIPLRVLIEDPNNINSAHSYFIQTVDIISYLIKQRFDPNRYFRSRSRKNIYSILSSVSCQHVSDRNDGIVLL